MSVPSFDPSLHPLIQPGLIPLHAEGPEPVLMPDASSVFADRARRFDHWAVREPAQRDFHAFMASLARAQQSVVARARPTTPPDVGRLDAFRAHRMPVLPASLGDLPDPWVGTLRALLAAALAAPAVVACEPAAMAAARGLVRASDAELVALGEALLAFDHEALPPHALPWLAAALQVAWVAAAAALGPDAVHAIDVPTICPCCGSLPVASVVRIGGQRQGLRYLVCSLCATQWHLVRVKCSHCESTKDIGYLSLSTDPDSEAGREAATRQVVKAETCDACASYLKVVSLEADPQADPVADDLATLALDLLTDARGYARIGPNLFVHPGVAA